MSTPPLGYIGYNVDCLAACGPSGFLVAGLSNFVGPVWTGGIAVLLATADAGAPQLQSLLELRAGVPAVTCLPVVDQFTGRRVVAAGGDDGSLSLLYLSGGGSGGGASRAQLEPTQSKVLHDDAVLSLTAAPGSTQLASGSADGTVRLWDCVQLLACKGQLGSGACGAAVHGVAWTADPATLASVSQDGSLRLWDTRQLGGSASAAAAVGAPALSVAAAAVGSQPVLVVGDQLGRASVWDPRNLAQPLQLRQLHQDAVHALASSTAISSDSSTNGSSSGSSMVASGSDDGSILLLDCSNLQASRQLVPARQAGEMPCYVRALAWTGSTSGSGSSSGQQQLARGGWDQAVACVAL